jgi:hypothetical protein
MTYTPKVNDYVKWENQIEGWVYFRGNQYITIETSVRPKDIVNYTASPIHANERLLVICYKESWKDLTFVKTRKSIYEE